MLLVLILAWLCIGLFATAADVLRRMVNVAWRCAQPEYRWPTLRYLLRHFQLTPAQRRTLLGNVLGGPIAAVGLWLIWRGQRGRPE